MDSGSEAAAHRGVGEFFGERDVSCGIDVWVARAVVLVYLHAICSVAYAHCLKAQPVGFRLATGAQKQLVVGKIPVFREVRAPTIGCRSPAPR
jgi:hypothetical protein